jgi:signal transduction histidine kinase
MVAIAPVLIAVVFLGAVMIGRRVAAPIEAARRRQLEFTADASHELRTPLSVIEAHTSLALAADRSPEWYRRAFEKIEPEGRRMRHLLDDLLWLARFDASRGAPNAEPVDVATLAAQAVDRFGPVAEARHLNLAVESAPGAHVVNVPPEWLDRLLGVLLDNAVRYSPEGGSVTVRVEPDAARVRLVVDDSGPGIAPDARDRIFDRFHRASEKPGGAGLGLAIGDAIVRATNGRWRIGTSPQGGASMSVTWPRAFSPQPEPGASAARTSVAGSD